MDKAINSLIEDLAKQASLDPNEGLDNVNENELLNLLMKGMGNPGSGEGDFDADAMIDGMMEQLLCKVCLDPDDHCANDGAAVLTLNFRLLTLDCFLRNLSPGSHVRAYEASRNSISEVA